MSGANLPLLNVIIPLLVEKRRSEGELDAQIERNSFASTEMRGYLLDPILRHHSNESTRKKSMQGSRNTPPVQSELISLLLLCIYLIVSP